jgi:hypothetical protein
MIPTTTKPSKSQYSETEVAAEVGVSVDQLRQLLIKTRIVEQEEDLNNVATTVFQPSDLVLLKLLAKASTVAA